MQLGFVIDQSRCIGCHACTVACKAENDVPVGSFRTWVKYTEQGAFPEVRRSFAVLRCNQCSDAPCVTICPVTALDKRDDGIVDIDPEVCIGCKACTQACPYDALYINDARGVAEKCHFCAHRVERGLAPACAVVCPTEAIVPGDLHDPQSRVSRMRESFDLTVRKPEAGTGPNVLYREAAPAGLDPSLTNAAGGYLWSQQRAGPLLEADEFAALEARARPTARTTYNVDRAPLWGGCITGYVFFKSLAAGVFLAGAGFLAPVVPAAAATRAAAVGVPALALLFLGLTLVLLVADLKRPERFAKILLRPNWDSWLARGSFVLMAYGLLLAVWLGLGLSGVRPAGAAGVALVVLTSAAAVLSAVYTAWLFAQAKARVLWMKRGLALQLFAQAAVAGAGLGLLLEGLFPGRLGSGAHRLDHVLLTGLGLHLLLVLFEERLAPIGREPEYARVAALVTRGPFARGHWLGGVGLGVVVPAVLVLASGEPLVQALAGVCALAGLAISEHVFVRAGQALPIS